MATEADDQAERERLFALVERIYAGYADYRLRAAETGRMLPIMRLKQI
jgi:hypothetical protein